MDNRRSASRAAPARRRNNSAMVRSQSYSDGVSTATGGPSNATPSSTVRGLAAAGVQHVTLSRDYGMAPPDLLRTRTMPTIAPTAARNGGRRAPGEPPSLRLRLAYDWYLCSAAQLCAQRANARKIASNVRPQTDVFAGAMAALRRESSALAARVALKTERDDLVGKIGILETLLRDTCTSDCGGEDARAVPLFADAAASGVVAGESRQMNAGDMIAGNHLINEIQESLRSFDCRHKIEARDKLKDLLIREARLKAKMGETMSECSELSVELESLDDYNTSLKILKAQLGEDPDASLLPRKSSDLAEEFVKILDRIGL